jgi:hypothetical protein
MRLVCIVPVFLHQALPCIPCNYGYPPSDELRDAHMLLLPVQFHPWLAAEPSTLEEGPSRKHYQNRMHGAGKPLFRNPRT